MKLVRMAATALGILLVSASLAQAAPAKLQIGSKVEPFSLYDLEGKETQVKFDKKVNVVSFWVSTCNLCKAELKAINELSEKFKDVAFTVVSTDFGGARMVNYVLQETQTVSKVPILMDKTATIATQKYGVTRFPFLVVVGAGGNIMWIHDGWEENSAAKITAEIEYRLK